MNKPKSRSNLRLLSGSVYFYVLKYIDWYCSGKKFSRPNDAVNLRHEFFCSQSLLLKRLKHVEMWMQLNKTKKLNLAIKKLNGVLIKPGETFSFWLLVGKPTAPKGYLPGMVLYQGGFTSGIGGGLCQLSNLIFWITLHTPLTVTERWRHSYDVFPDVHRTQPFGSGATCSYPHIDLQIKNNTTSLFQLRLELSATHLVGRWLSDEPPNVRYSIEERNHIIKHEWWGGYTRHNQLVQMVYHASTGEKISENLITENHAIMMYDPLLKSPS